MRDRAKGAGEAIGFDVKIADSGKLLEGLSFENISEMIKKGQLSQSDRVRRPGGIWQTFASTQAFASAFEAVSSHQAFADAPSERIECEEIELEETFETFSDESDVPLPSGRSFDGDASTGSCDMDASASKGAASAREVLSSISGHVGRFTQTETVEVSSVRSLFREVFSRHSSDDMEQHFAVGLSTTTPELSDIQLDLKPWVFVRSVLFFGLAYIVLLLGWSETENLKLLPGLILIGSFAIPVSFTIFFFECNLPKNISLYTVIKLFVWGGILGIMFSLILYEIGFGTEGVFGASAAAFLEEPAKLAAVLVLANATRHHWTLNGICMGAAVGAGFAAFESAGYALESLFTSKLMPELFAGVMADGDGIDVMVDNIFQRSVLAPFGHVIWTAILAGALFRVKGNAPLEFSMLGQGRFLRPALVVVALHFVWNSPVPDYLPFFIGYIVLGLIGWMVVLGLMLGGLKQIRQAQQDAVKTADLSGPESN